MRIQWTALAAETWLAQARQNTVTNSDSHLELALENALRRWPKLLLHCDVGAFNGKIILWRWIARFRGG